MDFTEAYQPFRAIGSSWKLFLRAPLTILVGGILLSLTGGGGGGGGNFGGRIGQDGHWHFDGNDFAAVAPFIGIACCVGIALWLFHCLLLAGFPNAVERIVTRGEEKLGEVFDARGQWLPMLLTTLLVGAVKIAVMLPGAALAFLAFWLANEGLGEGPAIAAGVGVSLLYAPVWIYVWLGISLAPKAVALEGLGPVQSVARSWSLVAGNRLWLLLYWIVMILFTFVGICACCIGVLFTGALSETAQCESYLRLVRRVDQSAWWIDRDAAETGPEPEWRSHDEPPPPPPTPEGGPIEEPPPRTDTDYV